MSAPLPTNADIDLPALGVGITYSPTIEPLFQRSAHLVDLLEIEPQTTWIENPAQPGQFSMADEVLEHLVRLPGRKLVHSVGVPVGGTMHPEEAQVGLLHACIAHLGSPWASEHLSFNATPEFRTGFFLPARQTLEGVEAAAESIRVLQERLPVPLAVETGVNYLRRRGDELLDGEFVSRVVEATGCGLLLDLHNVFTNACNGRQPVEDFLDQIPLDRVWEIHMAGGFEMEGYWLDAHSGAIPPALMEIARRLMPQLPNVKAIVFEMYPSFVQVAGFDLIAGQLELLHELWESRGTGDSRRAPTASPAPTPPLGGEDIAPETWERALGGLVIGRGTDGTAVARELAEDAGIGVVGRMVDEFRASLIVSTLRLTSRLLMLSLGPDVFKTVLRGFWATTPPQQYASSEARAFANYLAALQLQVPHLATVLEFERAVIATLVDDRLRMVTFDVNPLPLFRALAEGHLPDEPLLPGTVEIEITPGAVPMAGSPTAGTAQQVFPFH